MGQRLGVAALAVVALALGSTTSVPSARAASADGGCPDAQPIDAYAADELVCYFRADLYRLLELRKKRGWLTVGYSMMREDGRDAIVPVAREASELESRITGSKAFTTYCAVRGYDCDEQFGREQVLGFLISEYKVWRRAAKRNLRQQARANQER